MTPGRPAEHVGLSKQALNPLLNELERMGYIVRVANPEDGRSRTIERTARVSTWSGPSTTSGPW